MKRTTHNTVQFFNTTSGLVHGGHGDETKSTRTPRLAGMLIKARKIGIQKTHTLIIDNCNFFYASIPAELIIQVSLCATDTEAKNAENTGGVRGLR